MSFQERYADLNDKQRQAVDTIEGPVMVVAGPGTGKTELLSVRVANILQKTDTLPENILCLTFTESGQIAMRERLFDIIGNDAYKVAIHTFHSFSSEIIALNREYFYNGASFSPADELKQYEVLRGIFDELDPKNPLASTMNGEYTHLSDAKKVISELKRQGGFGNTDLNDIIEQNEASLDVLERILAPIAEPRVSKGMVAGLEAALKAVFEHANTIQPIHDVTPIAQVIAHQLLNAIEEAKVNGDISTKPISAWKSAWFERNDAKEFVFKDRKRLAKLKSLSGIFYEYLVRMERLGLFDFDDMIMQVVHALETKDDLRFNLQEKYLYVMVDEFQDTNLAQLRIIDSLTNNPVNEGRPNVLVVGDDDQAVYGFQGADISNILNFEQKYPEHNLIVLTDNYRSGAEILQTSRTVILEGGDRLESRRTDISKQLTANKEFPGEVEIWNSISSSDERADIARDIRKTKEQYEAQHANDPDPAKRSFNLSEVAVLARRHNDIQSLLPFFQKENIPVRYEREESVLDTEPIMLLEKVSRVSLAIAEGNHGIANTLLPELLAHPAFGLTPKTIWRLSLNAYINSRQWLEIMETTPELVPIHEWFVSRAADALILPLEPMVDSLIGNTQAEYTPDPEEDTSAEVLDPFEEITRNEAIQTSPLFTYFFSNEALAKNPDAYIEFLSALRTIRTKLRDYKPGETLSLRALVDFIDLHRQLDVGISVKRFSVASDQSAVQLLTAHKSKGLEFETVYVYNAIDNVWGETTRSASRNISYPKNLDFAPAGSTADERLRLFYVAMTRAKSKLIITHAKHADNDKQIFEAGFLAKIELERKEQSQPTAAEEQAIAQAAWYEPLTETTTALKELLAPQLEKFKLAATSFNNFLDITRGGPQQFLLNNLLHFPSAKIGAAGYGTAIHRALQQAHTHLTATGEQKPLEDILHDFELELKKERLSNEEFQVYLQQGSEHLPIFLQSNAVPMKPGQKAEVDFKHQDVRVGQAKLTGSLDMVETDEEQKTLWVTDYKTGHPSTDWDKGNDGNKIKLHKYRQQLIFYKLLAENSSEYSKYKVTHGQLAFIEPTKAGETIVLPLELDILPEEVEHTRKLIETVWHHIITLNLPDTSGYSQDYKGVLAFEQDLIDEVV